MGGGGQPHSKTKKVIMFSVFSVLHCVKKIQKALFPEKELRIKGTQVHREHLVFSLPSFLISLVFGAATKVVSFFLCFLFITFKDCGRITFQSFPASSNGKGIHLQCRRPGFDPWGQEDSLEKGMATHSSILAWRITWTEEPGRLQSMWWRRVGHDCD